MQYQRANIKSNKSGNLVASTVLVLALVVLVAWVISLALSGMDRGVCRSVSPQKFHELGCEDVLR